MTVVPPSRGASLRARILLVDDDLSLGALVSEYAAYEDYAVSTAPSGESGLRMIAERSYALVILDVMLPDVDGFHVLERLRAFSDVPVLMLTTRGAASDRIRGLRMGADDYLPKPFEPNELFARVGSILRRVQPTSNGLWFILADDVELDVRAHRVARGGIPVELTGAEFSLLQLLLSNPGRILSRQHLIPQVFRREEYAIDRSIDSLVSNLRRKLGPLLDGKERIRSVRGVGYIYVTSEPEKRM